MQVFKFGGASVRDAASVINVGNIIKKYGETPLIVVVSAMGKTTNALELVVQDYYKQKGKALELLEVSKKYHELIVQELIPDFKHEIYNKLNNKWIEIEWILEEAPTENIDYYYDQIVGVGEFVSTLIVSAYLQSIGINNTWIDARDLIRTDNNYREGNVDMEYSATLIEQHLKPILDNNIVITQGFVGGTSENYITTLGREGSDYSAAILANLNQANKMTVWKDVHGVMNADPRIFDFAKLLTSLSYQEAIEMTYFGASVIHPKTIKPLQNKNIPMYVRSFLEPEQQGTTINQIQGFNYPPIIVLKPLQMLVSISTNNYAFINEKSLSIIYQIFTQHKTAINLLQQSAMSVSICCNQDPMHWEQLIDDLKKHFFVKSNYPLHLLTIRHYRQEDIDALTYGKDILLEQRTRHTIQILYKNEE